MNYRFTLAAGNEYGASFQLRLATSSSIDGRLLSSRGFPTVTIQNGTALDTIDTVTMAVLDSLVGTDKLGKGVTIAKGLTGTRTVDWDAAAAGSRTRTSVTIDSGDTRTR